jgi:hypothetical protein
MTDEQVLRRLRAIRFSPARERNARRSLSINAIAKRAGLARPYLFEIISTGRIGSIARDKLIPVLTSQSD